MLDEVGVLESSRSHKLQPLLLRPEVKSLLEIYQHDRLSACCSLRSNCLRQNKTK
jgi:hypothetical protein